MANIPIDIFPNTADLSQRAMTASHITIFFKAGGVPAASTTLWDANFGASGYWRLTLTTALNAVVEWSGLGNTGSVNANGGTALNAGTWYWVDTYIAPANPNASQPTGLVAQCWAPGGISPAGAQHIQMQTSYGTGDTIYTLASQFGVGQSTSSAYNNWPNSPGWEWSKCAIQQALCGDWADGYVNTIGPPLADYTTPSTSLRAYWKCRDAVGSQVTLLDSSGNGYNLTGTFTVVADGPYA